LLVYSVGAALGPLAAAPMMDHFGPGGLFVFISGALGLFGLVIGYRLMSIRQRRLAYPGRYTPAPRTTQSIHELESGEAALPPVRGGGGQPGSGAG